MNEFNVGDKVYAFHRGGTYYGFVARKLKLTIEIKTKNGWGDAVYLKVAHDGKQNASGKHKTSLWPDQWLLYDQEAAKTINEKGKRVTMLELIETIHKMRYMTSNELLELTIIAAGRGEALIKFAESASDSDRDLTNGT
jgi:hypothetical protein